MFTRRHRDAVMCLSRQSACRMSKVENLSFWGREGGGRGGLPKVEVDLGHATFYMRNPSVCALKFAGWIHGVGIPPFHFLDQEVLHSLLRAP